MAATIRASRRHPWPPDALAGRRRARLLTRLEQLKKQHGWGALGDAEYLAARDAARAALAALPDDDRIRSFDVYRGARSRAARRDRCRLPARREELCRVVVERVVVRDRQVETITWTPPAGPVAWYPQGDSNP